MVEQYISTTRTGEENQQTSDIENSRLVVWRDESFL